MQKKQLRKTILRELREMEDTLYWQSSETIQDRFLAEYDLGPTDLIGITISRVPEVDTTNLIKKLWQKGVRVAAPKCDVSLRTMQFYHINSFEQLETIYMDLKEPIPELTEQVDVSELNLLVVPGVVFSPNGYRIGFGGGYYDRFLTSYKGGTVSLAFDCQIVAELPVEEHDLPVDRIITEVRTVECREERR